ncbi:MAG: FAD-dependent oxidoreductase, partial [Betaproteobacteria bacterium]
MKIAIIGSGISGLSVAHQLRGQADLTLFEAGDYFGGHTHTVDVTLPDASGAPVTHGVDTGFLVFNERTYPHLIRLLAELGRPDRRPTAGRRQPLSHGPARPRPRASRAGAVRRA